MGIKYPILWGIFLYVKILSWRIKRNGSQLYSLSFSLYNPFICQKPSAPIIKNMLPKESLKKIKRKRKNSLIGAEVYLDYAAGAPLLPIAMKAMHPYFSEIFGNPESVHSFGQDAMKALDSARETLAKALHTSFRGLIFTASATEANNIFLQGAMRKFRNDFPGVIPKVIISSLEHSSVRAVAECFAHEGVEIVTLLPNEYGSIDPQMLSRTLDERVVFVSVIHGNNEIGLVHPIRALGEVVRAFRVDRVFPLLHTDAVQTFPYLSVGLDELCVDGITVSGHKMGGPKGSAALAFQEGSISPILFGGGQEFELRPGTQNIPAIVGFSAVVKQNEKIKEKNAQRVNTMKEKFWKLLKKEIPRVERNEYTEKKSFFLPHILSFRVKGISAEKIIIGLSLQGIALSAGSACTARHTSSPRTVRVLWGEERAKESVRASFALSTTTEEITKTVRILKNILER